VKGEFMNIEKREKLYEGKAKIIYSTDDPTLIIQYFKDDATAFNGEKKGTIENKGILNNKISTQIFQTLELQGIKTHFVKMLNDREMLTKRVEIIPLEVVIRNYAAGSLVKRLNFIEGTKMFQPILEFYYKNDDLGDPLINKDHIKALRIADSEEMRIIGLRAYQINNILTANFDQIGIKLADFKLEFGRFGDEILLADEISPDSCRLWDKEDNTKLDKDRFRFDLGNVEEAYQDIYERMVSN